MAAKVGAAARPSDSGGERSHFAEDGVRRHDALPCCPVLRTMTAGTAAARVTSVARIAMDSLITAAAQALAAGDPFGALNRVALREDPPALALRGIAMAQLGDLERARALLRRAGRAFGPREAVARARCVLAEAEIAFVSRDLGWPETALAAARAVLERHGDRANAAHARCLALRRLLLLSRLDEAEQAIAEFDPRPTAGGGTCRVRAGRRRASPYGGCGPGRRARRSTGPRRRRGRRESRRCRRRSRRGAGAEHARCATDRGRGGAAAAARGGRGAAGVASTGRGRLPSHGARPRCLGGARQATGPVRATARPGRGLARRCRARACSSGAHSVGSTPTNRIARGCGSRSGGCARMLRPLAGIGATERGFALAPRRAREVVVLAQPEEIDHAAVLALLGRRRGVVQLSCRAGARHQPADACKGRSTHWRQPAGCSRSGAAGRAAG